MLPRIIAHEESIERELAEAKRAIQTALREANEGSHAIVWQTNSSAIRAGEGHRTEGGGAAGGRRHESSFEEQHGVKALAGSPTPALQLPSMQGC